MSWRDEIAEAYERACGLNPEALGIGPIDRTAKPWWKNHYIMANPEVYAMIGASIEFAGRDRRRIKREQNKAARKARKSA